MAAFQISAVNETHKKLKQAGFEEPHSSSTISSTIGWVGVGVGVEVGVGLWLGWVVVGLGLGYNFFTHIR